jgi:hypothetical protein
MELGSLIPSDTLRRLNPHLFCPGAQSGKLKSESGNAAMGSERELHEKIFDECRRRGWIALHGSMAERTCRTLGEPDFTILADRGRVFFVECKSRIGKLSPTQAALKLHAEKLGHTVHVVRSMEEFWAVTADHQPENN